MNLWNVAIVGVILVAYWGGMIGYKRYLADQITKAMSSGNQKKYEELLFSKRALIFLNPNSVCLMRANHCMATQKMEEGEKYLNMVKPKKLGMDQAVNYYQVLSMMAMNKKDTTMIQKIMDDLKERRDDSNAEIIDEMIRQNEINWRLYCEFDATVIGELEKLVKQNEGVSKGVMFLSLAKAYHLDHQAKKAEETLKRAKTLLKGTMYEEIVDATLSDPSIMDMD